MKKKWITKSFPNPFPLLSRLISHPWSLRSKAFRSLGPYCPVLRLRYSESQSPDPVPKAAPVFTARFCSLPNSSFLCLLLPLRNLSLRCPVSESLGGRVFTVPLLPLRSPSPHRSTFTSPEPVSSHPVPFRPSPRRSAGPHNPAPQTTFPQMPENSDPSPFPKSRLGARVPTAASSPSLILCQSLPKSLNPHSPVSSTTWSFEH